MNDKASRQRRREIWKYLREHRSVILTCTLIISIITLLFGIATQLPGLPSDGMVTTGRGVDYSTFIKQTEANNVQAVVIRGSDINALLKQPIDEKNNIQPTSQKTSLSAADDYALWSRSLNSDVAPVAVSDTSTTYAGRSIYMRIPEGGEDFLLTSLQAKNVQIVTLPVAQTSVWLATIVRFLPIIVLVILLLVFFRPNASQNPMNAINERMRQVGKSRARRFEHSKEVISPADKTAKTKATMPAKSHSVSTGSVARVVTVPQVTFNDVAGIDEVRSELQEMVQFLQSPERYNRLGARIPRGALLVGSPGTGKTLLAKAVAGEAQVPFFSMSASEFVEMFVGVGASRVRDLFAQARQVAPCVIFIDEIDAVGRKRTMRATGSDERDQTLNQLLVELDGFDARQAVVVLAATNRVDILDKALLRPGRFDRRITVSLPDRVGREAILRVHTRETPLHTDVELARLAHLTTGMSGADLANLVNEAALSAARRELEAVDHECFEDALARVQLGALRPIVMSEAERRIIAVHEGGHALVAYHLPEADTVNRVTILPRGQSLGVTQFTAEADRYNYSRETLMARIAVGLGGRVAEELTFGPDRITTGAENDLQVVTGIARKMVTRWGMSQQFGVVFADYQPEEGYSLNSHIVEDLMPQAQALAADAHGNLIFDHQHLQARSIQRMSMTAPRQTTATMTSALIDAEVQRILNDGREMARQILIAHADQLALLTEKLIEHEQLDRTQFEGLLA